LNQGFRCCGDKGQEEGSRPTGLQETINTKTKKMRGGKKLHRNSFLGATMPAIWQWGRVVLYKTKRRKWRG